MGREIMVVRCTASAAGTRRGQVARRLLTLVPASWLWATACVLAQPAACPPAAREGCPATPDAALLPFWNELPDRDGWQMLVSPAFPRSWPPPADGTRAVVRYAFAMRLNPAIADGAEVAAPWASVTLGARGVLGVERLPGRLRPLGVQGVRPLRSGEVVLAGREEEVAGLLLAGCAQDRDGLVREFTCGWISRQGVVAAAITPLHAGFIRWLACPRPVR